MIVRDFHAVIGQETPRPVSGKMGVISPIFFWLVWAAARMQWDCFNEFVDEPAVRLIGVEAAGEV